MSHYNDIHQLDAETVQEASYRQVAQKMHSLYNKVSSIHSTQSNTPQAKYEFNSGEYFREVDLQKKQAEHEKKVEKLSKPPLIKKKAPLINTGSPVRLHNL